MKPRYSAWISGGTPLIIPAAVVFALAIPGSAFIAYQFGLCALAILLSGIGWRAWAIWRERANPPPVPRFWDVGEGFRLEVRRQGTGEVLLRRRQPHLRYANLRDAALSGADLRGVSLEYANCRRADLRGADLRGCVLSAAIFRDADLTGARLTGARLSGASFARADLSGADLRGAESSYDSNLGSTSFAGAEYDESTRWPTGFNPERQRCRLAKHDAARLPIPATRSSTASDDLPMPASAEENLQVSDIGGEHSELVRDPGWQRISQK